MFRPTSYLTEPLPTAGLSERRRRVFVVTPFSAGGNHPAERVAQRLINEISAEYAFDFRRSSAAPAGNHQNKLPGSFQSFRRMTSSLPRFDDSIRAADLVWLHGTSSAASVFAFRAARAYNKPIFITQHEGPDDRTGLMRRMRGAVVDKFFAEDMFRTARLTSFTSDTAADHYYRNVDFRSPVKIIPNGADTEIFQPVSAEKRRSIRAKFALRDDQPVLLYAGSFDRGDGIATVRHLARQMPDWRFWLAGEGRENPGSWFQTNLQVFSNRDAAGMAELYQAADLMILPYGGSALPLAAQEAMACGLPVMCSPSLAKGCRSAKPYMWAVDTFDGDPRATASLWASRLRAGRPLLPLDEAKTELSDLAQATWEWHQIASHYAEILKGLCKPNKNG